MAWTDPKTWTAEPLTSSDLNIHLRDNLNALKDPPTDLYSFNEASDYSTSSTTFTNVDGTDLSFTIDTNGGDVMVHLHCTITPVGGATAYFDFTVDGTRQGGDDGIIRSLGSTICPVSFTWLVQGLAAGSHTFVLQWKKQGSGGTSVTMYAGAGTTDCDLHPQFWVREVS